MKRLVMLILCAIVLLSCGAQAVTEEDVRYIIHACGEYEGYLKTNCLESLQQAYDRGNRTIEVDFCLTLDGYPVCIHDWNYQLYPPYEHYLKPTGTLPGSARNRAFGPIWLTHPWNRWLEPGYLPYIPPVLEDYLSAQVYGQFTSIWLEDVAQFLREHPDCSVVTDMKDDNVGFAGMICRDYPDVMEQFFVQVYSREEYFAIRELGFENIIFTLYNLPWEEKMDTAALVDFALENPLLGYTFPAELCEIPGYVDALLEAEIPLFVHTVNDRAAQRRYFELGISGIYTDNTIHK